MKRLLRGPRAPTGMRRALPWLGRAPTQSTSFIYLNSLDGGARTLRRALTEVKPPRRQRGEICQSQVKKDRGEIQVSGKFRSRERESIDEPMLGPRQMNRLRIIEALYRRPLSSRADLARHAQLSRETVSTLVEELVRAGLVEEHPGAAASGNERGSGRRASAPAAVARLSRRLRGRPRLRPPAHPGGAVRPVGRADRGRLLDGRRRPRAGREPRPGWRTNSCARRCTALASHPTSCSASAWDSRSRSTRRPAS